MSRTPSPIVVIGVGNVLLGDDAVGIRALEGLGRLSAADPAALPRATRLVDGGTLGLDLMRSVEGARAVLLLDAVDVGAEPGEIVVLEGDAIATAGARRPGGPAGGLGELLALARLMDWLQGPVALVGVQVGHVAFSKGMTPQVEAAVPIAVESARRTLLALDRGAVPAARDGVVEMEMIR